MNSGIFNTIRNISALDALAMKQAFAYSESLIKPLGSLGVLEDISIKLSGITGKLINKIHKSCVLVMCADNGVFEEGVALTPQKISSLQAINTVRGKTGVAVLAKSSGADVFVYDVGLCEDISHPGVINKKIIKGTANIAKANAMTYSQAELAIQIGIDAVSHAHSLGYDLMGAGEIGIANTTTSAAIAALYTGTLDVVGRGAGLSDSAFLHKKQVVKTAIEINSPDINDPIDVIAKIGGLDIAAMTGIFLGCAAKKIPCVIDGFISAVAALLSYKLCAHSQNYMFASHLSGEYGYNHVISMLKLAPMLNLNMRLGEGSGCPLAFQIIKSACDVFENMGTFEDDLSEVTDSYLKTVSREEQFGGKV